MSGDVELPKVGHVKKTYIYIGVGGAAAFVLWRYWSASRAAANTTAASADTTVDPGSVTDAAGGPVSGGNAGNTTNTTGTDGVILTNDQWAQHAADLLISAGWDSQTVVLVLGKYLNRQGLSDAEIGIVAAALAVAGKPPVGTYTINHLIGTHPVGTPAPAPKPHPAPKPAAHPPVQSHAHGYRTVGGHTSLADVSGMDHVPVLTLRRLNPRFAHYPSTKNLPSGSKVRFK